MKHVLEPHAADERDQVFCSFLALLMQKELFLRMAKAGIEAEWADILRDLDALTEVEIENGARRSTVAILRCVEARLPITIRRIDDRGPQTGRKAPHWPNGRYRAGHGESHKRSATRPKSVRNPLTINKTKFQTVDDKPSL
ncbi:MAG: hypothetical protein OXE82_06235 [Rhodobacter sp.]|nr:hypothetical protein [Rhodobacter sp.]